MTNVCFVFVFCFYFLIHSNVLLIFTSCLSNHHLVSFDPGNNYAITFMFHYYNVVKLMWLICTFDS